MSEQKLLTIHNEDVMTAKSHYRDDPAKRLVKLHAAVIGSIILNYTLGICLLVKDQFIRYATDLTIQSMDRILGKMSPPRIMWASALSEKAVLQQSLNFVTVF